MATKRDLQKEIDKIYKERKKEDKKRNLAMKKKGVKYILTYWIHPRSGDDYEMFTFLKKKPTTKQIKALIRSKGSIVYDDYHLKKL